MMTIASNDTSVSAGDRLPGYRREGVVETGVSTVLTAHGHPPRTSPVSFPSAAGACQLDSRRAMNYTCTQTRVSLQSASAALDTKTGSHGTQRD